MSSGGRQEEKVILLKHQFEQEMEELEQKHKSGLMQLKHRLCKGKQSASQHALKSPRRWLRLSGIWRIRFTSQA